MTTDSTFPSPAGRPRMAEHGVSVLPPHTSVNGLLLPTGRGHRLRHASRTPLLVADVTAALCAMSLVPADQRHPLLALVLLSFALWPHRYGTQSHAVAEPGVLDDLPALCGRIAVGWAVYAAIAPLERLAPPVLVLSATIHCAMAVLALTTVRGLRRSALRSRPRPTLVIGSGRPTRRVCAALLRDPGCGLRPVGIVADTPEVLPGLGDGPALPVLTTGEEVQRAVIQNGVEVVLAVGPAARASHGLLLRKLGRYGCAVSELDPGSPSYALGRPGTPYLAGFACRPLAGSARPSLPAGVAKRLLDVVVSGVLLLLTSPVLACCAIVLRLTEGPGVVFRQERVGKDGRPFTMMKFRTYRPSTANEAATRWSVADARGMSPFCQFLRRTSLDELLQLWNVFRGDMSLVGPRPERPFFVAQFSKEYPGYAERHRMRGGITGLAQVNGLRGDTSIEDRARYDNTYIDSWSLWQDMCILLRTAMLLIRPTGS
ncbi:exopolysaccharide biosynthesis polyprenyl glycosylphosphotransferase [Streptomyces sp. S.PB5]|uniref:exopolysaccharide biosynthesis polyprenyl glycosylphosphotransferase n=1 Tax=Streptomyces sp. S.PB5 TaxID=3020844 RepID=UPI0025B05DF3|nr:exopolysaccharide biosynthesis polyprenyl glycosylphosphotransferase [Streptomyces sp. S.PB5]MDN3022793.1 exopolysaccharide biosynthesis polyprenyl glycosylphosphotransferase [Streptomyces sp. S.PB5]